jgi:hypothetical protein
MSLRAWPTDIDATVGVSAKSPAPAIWVASWKPVAEDLKYVTPMVWLDGDFRPGQDNVSIDPESLAAATKRLPAGRRVIVWYRYFRSFWGISGDAVPCSDGTAFAGLWPVVSMPHITLRANNDETLPYAPDTLGKQESQSWEKSRRIVSIRLETFLEPLAGASATARSCALSRPRTAAPSLVN